MVTTLLRTETKDMEGVLKAIGLETWRWETERTGQKLFLPKPAKTLTDPLACRMLTENTPCHLASLEEGEELAFSLPGTPLAQMDTPWHRQELIAFFEALQNARQEAEDLLLNPHWFLWHPAFVTCEEVHYTFLLLPFAGENTALTQGYTLPSFCLETLLLRGVEAGAGYVADLLNLLRLPESEENLIAVLVKRLKKDSDRFVPSGTVLPSNATAEKMTCPATDETAPFLVPPSSEASLSLPLKKIETVAEAAASYKAPYPSLESLQAMAEAAHDPLETRPLAKTEKIAYVNVGAKAPIEKKKEEKAAPQSFLDLLMHFSMENWKRYREQREKTPSNTTFQKPTHADNSFHHADKNDTEETPLLWEENGNIQMLRVPGRKHPRLRFADQEEVFCDSLPLVIGRSGTAQIVRHNRHMSAQHARLSYENGRYMITDCQSTNGTFVNNRRLQPSKTCPITQGDRLRFGTEEALFLL